MKIEAIFKNTGSKAEKNKKRAKILVDEVFNGSGKEEKKEDSPNVVLADEIGKALYCDAVDTKLNRFDAMGPLMELEQYKMV